MIYLPEILDSKDIYKQQSIKLRGYKGLSDVYQPSQQQNDFNFEFEKSQPENNILLFTRS